MIGCQQKSCGRQKALEKKGIHVVFIQAIKLSRISEERLKLVAKHIVGSERISLQL